jgi:hypothetical protein
MRVLSSREVSAVSGGAVPASLASFGSVFKDALAALFAPFLMIPAVIRMMNPNSPF